MASSDGRVGRYLLGRRGGFLKIGTRNERTAVNIDEPCGRAVREGGGGEPVAALLFELGGRLGEAGKILHELPLRGEVVRVAKPGGSKSDPGAP